MGSNDNVAKTDLADLTLSEIVTKNFKSAAIFEKYGLDFCCRGKKSIYEACVEKEVSPEEVFLKLEELNQTAVNREEDQFNKWELDFLILYIINVHHKYVRDIIPVISAHAEKIAAKHGSTYPEVVKIVSNFSIVYKDLKQHMMKEEQILFPYIKYLVAAKNNSLKAESPYFGTIKNPIQMMEAEHESAGNLLAEIKILTNDYAPPAEACNTFKVYYQELREFEEDLHKHVHLENNILFPRSIGLEKELLS